MTSKVSSLAVLAFMMTASFANAFGVTKTLKFSIPNSSLGGYVATSAAGYTQKIQWGQATEGNSYALVYSDSPQQTKVLGDPTWITIISSSGRILSKERLPTALQPSLADCTYVFVNTYPTPNSSDACPSIAPLVIPVQQLGGKLLIAIGWVNHIPYTNGFFAKTQVYVLDTNTSLGSADRWTPLFTFSESNTTYYPVLDNPNSPLYTLKYTPASFGAVYYYDTSVPGGTSVYSIVNK